MNNNNYFIDVYGERAAKQFEKQCEILNQKYNTNINPDYYISQFINYTTSTRYLADLQEEHYMTLKTRYPNLDFGIRGRVKTAFSYFNKVLELLKLNPHEVADIYDLFANRCFLRSVDFPIDQINSYYDGSFTISSGLHELKLIESDAFVFDKTNPTLNQSSTIVLKNVAEQIIKKGSEIYIKDLDTGIMHNLANATLKRSNKDSLVPYLYDMEKTSNEFYASKGFEKCKERDYLATPKESGYSALHSCFYSSKLNLGVETHYTTSDMERASKEDPKQARNTYKKGSREINKNTLYQVPRYVLTTCTYDKKLNKTIPLTYIPSDDKCLEYTFHITKQSYLTEIALQEKIETLQNQLKSVTSDNERFKLQTEIQKLKAQSLTHTNPEFPSR